MSPEFVFLQQLRHYVKGRPIYALIYLQSTGTVAHIVLFVSELCLDMEYRNLSEMFGFSIKVIRLDLSMNALLSLLRLKTFERILTQDERTLDLHISDIHSRHVLSTALKREQVCKYRNSEIGVL